jgi:hypothetical protein
MRRPSGRGFVHVRDDEERSGKLLGAIVVGAVVAAGIAVLFRRDEEGHRPIDPALRAARRGAGRAMKRGRKLIDELPVDQARDLMEDARARVSRAVDDEVRSLRRAMRRRRKQLGL